LFYHLSHLRKAFGGVFRVENAIRRDARDYVTLLEGLDRKDASAGYASWRSNELDGW
jgi:hypothetical protein